MLGSFHFRILARVAVVVVLGGCGRPAHLEPVHCPPKTPLAHPTRTTVLAGMRGVVQGIVRRDDTNQPLTDASVVLRPGNRGVGVDSSGRFQFTSVPAGRYYIEARRVGFRIRSDSIDVAANAGTETAFALDLMMMDECPGFAAIIIPRRSWWKFW